MLLVQVLYRSNLKDNGKERASLGRSSRQVGPKMQDISVDEMVLDKMLIVKCGIDQAVGSFCEHC